MRGQFISTDIRYRNRMAMVESGDKVDNTESVDSVIDNNMDVSGVGDAGGGEDIGNLYETLEMIVEGAKSSAASNTEEDVSLNDVLDMIGEGGKQGVNSNGGASVDESRDVGGDETKSASEVTINSAPTKGDSGSDDSAITIDSSVETNNAGGDTNKSVTSNVSGSVVGDIKSVCKSECAGDAVSAIPPIPRFRLREIFQHTEGEFIHTIL